MMRTTVEERSQNAKLDDPQLQQIADRVLHTLQLAAEKAAMHLNAPRTYPMPSDRQSAEHIFLKRLQQRPADTRHAAITHIKAISTATRQAAYGNLAQVNFRSTTPIATQIDAIPAQIRFRPEALTQPSVTPKSGSTKTVYSGVRLRLHKMVCVEETSGLGGDDEILLGGVVVDPAGKTKKIKAFMVDADFDSGETKTYSPPRTFASFDFDDSNEVTIDGKAYVLGWPRTFQVTFALAEEDNGGFPGFLQDLYEVAEEYVIKEVSAAVGAVVGGAIGSTIPGLGTVIGAAVGAAVGWVMGALFEWLVSLWEDDIFVPATTAMTLSGPGHTWNGKTDSANVHKWWKGHGGHYELYFDWQVYGAKTLVVEPTPDEMTMQSVGAVDRRPPQRRTTEVDLFARGKDHRIYHIRRSGNAWTWGPIGEGTFDSGPAAASWGSTRLDVFARGKDARMYHLWKDGGDWSWGPIGEGTFTSGPAAASWGPNRLDVFARGGDHRIYHLWTQGSGWSWGPLGDGTFDSGPAAVSWGPNRLDVFAIGKDRRMYHTFWHGGGWSNWGPIGVGTFTSGPTAASWAPNRLDVFARGGDHRIYHAAWNGGGWSGWGAIGVGTFNSAPAAASVGPNRLDVYALGKDDRLRHAAWKSNKWHAWFDDVGSGTFS